MLLNTPHVQWHNHLHSTKIIAKSESQITETPMNTKCLEYGEKHTSFPHLIFIECFLQTSIVPFALQSSSLLILTTIQQSIEVDYYYTILQLRKYLVHAVWITIPSKHCKNKTNIASSKLRASRQTDPKFRISTTLLITPKS